MKNNKKLFLYEKETIKYYWQEAKKYKTTLFLGLLFIPMASVILDTIVPYYISLSVGLLTAGNYDKFYEYIIIAAIVAGLGVLSNLLGFQSIIIHESKVRRGLSNSTLRNILNKDHSFFVNQKIGSLTGKYIDYINGHGALQNLLIGKIIIFSINLIIGLLLIWQQAPMLAGIVILLTFGLLLQVKISKKLRMHLRGERKKLTSEINGLSADILVNNSTVKTFASESLELESLDKMNARFETVYKKDFRWHSVDGTSRIFVMQTMQIITILILGNLLISKQIEVSIAIFVIVYLQRMSSQLFSLGEILFGYDKIMLQTAPMSEIMTIPEKIVDKTSCDLLVNNGRIEFKDVTYCYPDSRDAKVLDVFNLIIEPGQKVGLVGYSGAGKTTLTKLLLRLDDISKGQILIDDQDISMITQSSLRRSISYVTQDPMLFHRSLRENIAYGSPDSSDSQIIEASKLANAYEFIEKLPKGLDTIVGERGIKLSGGQRQRIVIARAILKNAPILILDEATSSLDSESELLIQRSLDVLMKKRTSLVVAHRLSTISKLDRIIVLQNGKIIEDGKHSDLIIKNGKYAKLWNHQAGSFIDDNN